MYRIEVIEGHITDLEEAADKQVRLRGDALGRGTSPVLTPMGTARGQRNGTVSQRVVDMYKKVDVIFQKDKKLLELERGVEALEVWTHTEPSAAASVLRQERAKRRHVAEHAGQLKDFAQVLAEVKRLQPSINAPYLQELPACAERLKRLEARSAVAVGSAARLHDQVAKLAEQYHQAMLAVSAQMLRWDGLLSAGSATGGAGPAA